MGKWMNKTINPSVVSEAEDHILIEDLARLAEGTVDAAERQNLIGHLNRCQRCYQTLQETLKDVSAETTLQPGSVPWWRTRMFSALAASILLVLLIGGPLSIKHWIQRPPVILAVLDLDQGLKDILLEDDALKWEKKRAGKPAVGCFAAKRACGEGSESRFAFKTLLSEKKPVRA
jgi:hypothetical protein